MQNDLFYKLKKLLKAGDFYFFKCYLIIFLSAGMFCFSTAYAQNKPSITNETAPQKIKRMQWWTDARFGMFIHWGLYALPARHEWVKNGERMTNETYQKYFDQFIPSARKASTYSFIRSLFAGVLVAL